MAKVLTPLGITRLKVSNTRREVPDGKLIGLYVIVQPSGSKSFALRYRHNGKSKKLTLGKFPKMSLQEARERAREALESISYRATSLDGQAAQSALSRRSDHFWRGTYRRPKAPMRQRVSTSMIFYQPFEVRSCRTLPSEM